MRPETLLKCAEKAYPLSKWRLSGPTMAEVRTIFMPSEMIRYFKLQNGDDQMALQIALEKEGWTFFYSVDEFFAENGKRPITAKTKPELLAACVESTQE